jgi:hypothetical protein
MDLRAKSDFSELDEMFKRAVEKANQLDVDEPLLVWPELPPSLKNPKRKPEEKNQPEK